MRVGMAGLAALYWPVAIGNGIRASQEVAFAGAATLGVEDAYIEHTLRMSPSAYAERYGVQLYETAEEMIAAERLDTVVMITQHTEHAEWAERLAALGVDIFIPKTFATTVADAERIVQAGRDHGVRIAVGPSARFLPPFVALRSAIDEGLIGEPFALRICHHHGVIDSFGRDDWYREAAEGGPELSLGWYGVDLILHLMDDDIESVFAEYGNYTTPDSPFMDCGRIVARMSRGGVASFDMYFCNRVPYPSWQVEVLGPSGVLSIHRKEDSSRGVVVSLDAGDGYRALPVPEDTPSWETFWIDELHSGKEPTVGAEQAMLITEISLAARASAETGMPVSLQDRTWCD
jgi:predicted dehydrogenase